MILDKHHISSLNDTDTTDISEHQKMILPNYLQQQTPLSLKKLISVQSADELWQYLPHANEPILWLDLELIPQRNHHQNKTTKFIQGAMIIDNRCWLFNSETFTEQHPTVLKLINQVQFLGGHNLIDFDLPQFINLFRGLAGVHLDDSILSAWQKKSYDTLRLSSLFFPHQPSHALSKLYKVNTQSNDPILDCVESRLIWMQCQNAWNDLTPVCKALFYQLLPAMGDLSRKDSDFLSATDIVFDWQDLLDDLPDGNKTALIKLIKERIKTAQKWQNLGIACFISWLRFLNKPVACQPIWVKKHTEFALDFIQTEQLFWQTDTDNQPLLDRWLDDECQAFFGYQLREGQKNIVRHIFQDNNMTLGVLPTGGGKSLSFQLPALIMSKYYRHLTVVISPLQALIEDQVIDLKAKLRKTGLHDYETRVDYLTANQTPETQNDVLNAVWLGQVDILYLSPERLASASIKRLFKHRQPAFWVLDEAHTLSQWGIDFRPDFLRIAEHILACYNLKVNDEQQTTKQPKSFIPPKIALVTATASTKIREDLKKELTDKLKPLVGMQKDLSQCGLTEFRVWRDNITLHFLQVPKDKQKSTDGQNKKTKTVTYDLLRGKEALKIILRRKLEYQIQCVEEEKEDKGVALVYLRSRKLCEKYVDYFSDQDLKAAYYHSKLSKQQKQDILSKFKNHELDVVVCTNAFGMGIDKEGIHTVIHAGVPNNLESYVQEIGRGARKQGETAQAYLLWSEEDIDFLFTQDKKSRIPNANTLKDCWGIIRPVLDKAPKDRWVSANALSPILQINETEELNTHVRVALLALERHGLLKEKEHQPAYVNIKLLDKPADKTDESLLRIYKKLTELSGYFEDSNHLHRECYRQTRYYLPDLAQVLGYNIKELLKKISKLVEAGCIQWKINLTIKSKYKQQYQQTLYNRALKVCNAMQQYLADDEESQVDDELTSYGYTTVYDNSLSNWLKNNQIKLKPKDIFAVLRALNVVLVRKNQQQWQVEPTLDVKNRLKYEDKVQSWSSWLTIAKENHQKLQSTFEHLHHLLDTKDAVKHFDLHDLASVLQLDCHELLLRLETLQKLNIIELSALSGADDLVFFVDKGVKSNFSDLAYQYLKEHYDERCQKIHVLYQWLKEDNLDTKKEMLEDYFRCHMSKMVEKYVPSDIDSTKPYLKDYQSLILPNWLNETQKKIITNTKRASLVLAGPGSGKTTVVVHRVAYLLTQENIDPQKILILAYNRMAVYELRMRLKKLVDKYASGVTITTFHGLARSIIDRSENDVSEQELEPIIKELINQNSYKNKTKNELKEAARFIWLIDEAIRTLQEDPKFYQYIMVDEFQDIDEKQYTLISMLADLKKTDIEDVAEDDDQKIDKTNVNKDAYDQQGYLMVVGDDDQNLYEWRGASVRFIQQFEHNYHITSNEKFYLLENYRSSPNIVALANAFIQKSLPQEHRLKDAKHSVIAKGNHSDTQIYFAGFSQIKGIDMAYWLSEDIVKKLQHMQESGKKQSIAVLAPRWEIFDAVQHYLQEKGIVSQRFNEQEDTLLPANSVIGRALQEDIVKRINGENNDGVGNLTKDTAIEFLQKWREERSFNPIDTAWQAILYHVSQLTSFDLESILIAIKTAQYDDDKTVSLITYYSAKGMEFDHVYVIDDRKYLANNLGDIRSLYVALTRAKTSLTILQNKHQYNQDLCDLLNHQRHGTLININPVNPPECLKFNRYLTLKEIVLTPPELTCNDEARAFISQEFAKGNWGQNSLDIGAKFNNDGRGFFSPGGRFLVGFSRSLREKPYTRHITISGFTTTYYFQRELSHYQRVGYKGNEREHCLIVPLVTITIPLI